MASLLDTFIRKEVAKGFKGKLLRGLLMREVVGSVNDLGDPTVSSVETYTFEGIRDHFDARYAATAAIPTTDVRILIISGLITPVTTPRKDDKIRIRGAAGQQQWHQVRAVLTVDPANAHIVLQCFEIDTPAGAPS